MVHTLASIVYTLQGVDAEVRLGMSGATTALTSYEHVVRMPMITVSPVHLARALWTVALLTVGIDISTALYKPASGVVFAHSSLAYYLTLTAIFVLGVAEAFTAFWVSSSRDADVRRLTFGRVVLCASVGPFVAIVGIGGFAFIEG